MNRKLARVGAAVLIGAAALLPVAAQAVAAPSREEILAQLKVDQVAADYVVLVDTSGSMSGLYPNVKRTLQTFLTGLTAADHVAVFTFDNTPTPRYNGPGGDPARIVASLPDAPSPNRTDIGAALEKAVEELERPAPAPVASVVLITDGAHEPPDGSRYPTSTDAQPWQDLATRAGKLKAQVKGYALPLTRDGVNGARSLGVVVKSTDTLDPSQISDMGAYLDRSKARTRLEKARLALAPDIGKGVSVTWDVPSTAGLGAGREATAMVTLRSETTKVPLTVTGLGVRATGGPSVTGDLPAELTLRPGESRSFALTVRWDPDAWLVPFHQNRKATTALRVTGTLASDWAAPLAPDIALDTPAAPADAQPPRLVATAEVGTWYSQGGTAALLLTVAVVLLVLFVRRRPVQSGVLLAREPMTGREQARFPLRGRRTRLAGNGLEGWGEVIAQRVPRTHTNEDGLEYVIRYRRTEHTSTSTLPSRGTVLLNGINFEHVLEDHRPGGR